jgi:glycine/D-amino acid oxidase-like deaminating enzyme
LPMADERFLRQRDILPPEQLAATQVTVIGCGAIGSFTVLLLAKMGIANITVFDGDVVAEHNLPNQWYKTDHLTWNKTDALWDIIYDFTEVELKAHDRHFNKDALHGIVICAVDSMDVRLQIWREVKKYRPDLYLDARMGAEVGKVLVATPSSPVSCRAYEEELYPSSEAFQAPCTAKATTYCAAGLSAFIASMVARYIRGHPVTGMVVDFHSGLLIPEGGGP